LSARVVKGRAARLRANGCISCGVARAILWLDAVVLVGLALAAGGRLPLLGYQQGAWTWLATAGSTLTAVLAALAAFDLTAPGRARLWRWLSLPGLALWLGASGLGCLALPEEAAIWGDTVEEAGECLRFLLLISAPLLALMLFMLWRAAPLMPWLAVTMGGIASAGAAATLLELVHPHDAAPLDLGAHLVAVAAVLAAAAIATPFARRRLR
jgi:hypothetical protein